MPALPQKIKSLYRKRPRDGLFQCYNQLTVHLTDGPQIGSHCSFGHLFLFNKKFLLAFTHHPDAVPAFCCRQSAFER